MLSFIRQHRLVIIMVVTIAGLAAVAIGYFGVHTLVIDDEVSEAAPTFDAQPAAALPARTEGAASTPTDGPVTSGPAEDRTSAPVVPDDSEELPDATDGDVAPPATTDAPVPEVVTEFRGTFVSGDHPTSGTAVVLGNGTGQRFLRFEGFETDNGPDLNVYLVNSSTGDVSDYVDLGDLAGNIGDQNYEIPRDVDLETYDQVVIWCVRFGVGFGSADLAAT